MSSGACVTSLDPSFRAQELAFAVASIGGNVDLTAAAERRSWRERVVGRQPEGLTGTLSAAHERGLRVTAVGVEDAVTWGRVEAIGFDTAQGFLIAPPMPPAELAEWRASGA